MSWSDLKERLRLDICIPVCADALDYIEQLERRIEQLERELGALAPEGGGDA